MSLKESENCSVEDFQWLQSQENFSQFPEAMRIIGVYKRILSSHPNAPAMPITCGDVERMIPTRLLTCQSSKFRMMLQSGMTEMKGALSLDDTKASRALLDYLADAHHEINGDNALALLLAADERLMEILGSACTKFVAENMDERLAVQLLPTLIEKRHSYLSFICSRYVTDPDLLPEDSTQARELVNRVGDLPAHWKFESTKRFPAHLSVIVLGKLLDVIEDLNQLNTICYIRNLIVDDPDVLSLDQLNASTQGLQLTGFGNLCPFKSGEALAEYLQLFSRTSSAGSSTLVMRGLDISEFPDISDDQLARCKRHFSNLFMLVIKNDKIRQLDLPNATYAYARSCPALTSLHAPNATEELHAHNCTALTRLDALNATNVDATGCIKLKQMIVAKGASIQISGCPKDLEIVYISPAGQ